MSSLSSVYCVGIVTLVLAFCDGNSSCDFEPCLETYNTLNTFFDTYRHQDVSQIPLGVIHTICSHQNELKDCTKKQSKTCRGDLNYHFFVRLTQKIQSENSRIGSNCSDITSSITGEGSLSSSYNNAQGHGTSGTRHSGRGHAFKCTAKYSSEPSVGCAIYGLTNLKSFSDPLNFTEVPYCSLSGAWSLLDLDSLAVQITNKGGLSPLPKDITTTTLVTVIVKSNECAERKMYQATFDEVPAMFSDGSTTAGNIYIEEVKQSEHVRIHFPHISTFVEIIRVIGHLPISTLSVTIKMPQSNAVNTSTALNRISKGVPLCFYGCPKTANIKPRSVDPTHRCSTQSSEDAAESSSTEFMDTANSITSAICDSLANVQSILKETSVLEQRVKFSGEENFVTQNDSGGSLQQHHNHTRHLKYPSASAAEKSALKSSQSVGNSYLVYRSLFLSFCILVIYTFR